MAAQASMARRFHILIKLALIALILISADFACLPKTAGMAAQAPGLVFAQAATHHSTNDNHGPGSDGQERGDDHCVQYKLIFQSNICRTDPASQLISYSAGSKTMSGWERIVINRPPIRAA
jgi:hypothetical protein